MKRTESCVVEVHHGSSGRTVRHGRSNSISLPIIAWEEPEPKPLPRNSETRKSFNLLFILNKNTTKNSDIFGSLKRRFLTRKRWVRRLHFLCLLLAPKKGSDLVLGFSLGHFQLSTLTFLNHGIHVSVEVKYFSFVMDILPLALHLVSAEVFGWQAVLECYLALNFLVLSTCWVEFIWLSRECSKLVWKRSLTGRYLLFCILCKYLCTVPVPGGCGGDFRIVISMFFMNVDISCEKTATCPLDCWAFPDDRYFLQLDTWI